MKGDKKFLPIHDELVMEGGGVYKGHEYMIVFVARGHRCGYVALKENEHNIFEKERNGDDYFLPNLQAHGGITFYENSHGAKSLLPIPCNDFWVGFDAAHWYDSVDLEKSQEYFGETEYIKFMKESHSDFMDVTNKSYEYMENECKGIIDQLLEISEKAA